MAEQDLIKTARTIVEEFNKGDFDSLKKHLETGYLYNEVGTGRQIRGPADFTQAMQGWKQAMPDVKGKINHTCASGNTVVLELTWEGTQTGAFQGPTGTFPASGKRQVTPAAWVFQFSGDKIKESHHYFDMYSFLQQIGALPQMAHARN